MGNPNVANLSTVKIRILSKAAVFTKKIKDPYKGTRVHQKNQGSVQRGPCSPKKIKDPYKGFRVHQKNQGSVQRGPCSPKKMKDPYKGFRVYQKKNQGSV